MARSRALLVASGTATLEAALAARPFAIFYRTQALNYWLARHWVRVPHIGLANLVAGERVAPEVLQTAATPATLAQLAMRLLDDAPLRARQLEAWHSVRARVGPPGASDRVAALARTLATPTGGGT
jgi:lipid-A-disaccharide synthase